MATYYVSPTGVAGNAGTEASPWDWPSVARAQKPVGGALPGDEIICLEGDYDYSITNFAMNGTLANRITVRADGLGPWPWGKRVRFRGPNATSVIDMAVGAASFVDFKWVEFLQTNINRHGTADNAVDGVVFHGRGFRLINCWVHEIQGSGVNSQNDSPDFEAIGVITYYNGLFNPAINDPLGHNFYPQNQPSVSTDFKKVRHCISFDAFSNAIQWYAPGLTNWACSVEDSAFWDAAQPTSTFVGYDNDILMDSGTWQSPRIVNNHTYYHKDAETTGAGFAGRFGSRVNPTITGNYFMAYNKTAIDVTGTLSGTIDISGNTFIGALSGMTVNQYGANTQQSTLPTVNVVAVKANPIDAGRGHVIIYNWQNLTQVTVDLSAILANGDQYEVRHAMDYFAATPTLSGTWNGDPIAIPMTGLTAAAVTGTNAGVAQVTGPRFGVFVVQKTGSVTTSQRRARVYWTELEIPAA